MGKHRGKSTLDTQRKSMTVIQITEVHADGSEEVLFSAESTPSMLQNDAMDADTPKDLSPHPHARVWPVKPPLLLEFKPVKLDPPPPTLQTCDIQMPLVLRHQPGKGPLWQHRGALVTRQRKRSLEGEESARSSPALADPMTELADSMGNFRFSDPPCKRSRHLSTLTAARKRRLSGDIENLPQLELLQILPQAKRPHANEPRHGGGLLKAVPAR